MVFNGGHSQLLYGMLSFKQFMKRYDCMWSMIMIISLLIRYFIPAVTYTVRLIRYSVFCSRYDIYQYCTTLPVVASLNLFTRLKTKTILFIFYLRDSVGSPKDRSMTMLDSQKLDSAIFLFRLIEQQ